LGALVVREGVLLVERLDRLGDVAGVRLMRDEGLHDPILDGEHDARIAFADVRAPDEPHGSPRARASQQVFDARPGIVPDQFSALGLRPHSPAMLCAIALAIRRYPSLSPRASFFMCAWSS